MKARKIIAGAVLAITTAGGAGIAVAQPASAATVTVSSHTWYHGLKTWYHG